MRVICDCCVSLTDSLGNPFPLVGWVNVFRNSEGKLVSGKRAYPTEGAAGASRRAPDSWTFLGTIRLEEYLAKVQAGEVAKSAVLRAYDKALSSFFPPVVEHEPAIVKRKKRTVAAIVKRTTVGAKKKRTPVVVAKKKK